MAMVANMRGQLIMEGPGRQEEPPLKPVLSASAAGRAHVDAVRASSLPVSTAPEVATHGPVPGFWCFGSRVGADQGRRCKIADEAVNHRAAGVAGGVAVYCGGLMVGGEVCSR
eukprot:CAMPEP_0179209562 /NCGR_PEP_ID=MMETSP0796-20121207/104516_1 /TAXON_ID=73915 /ORGANISM="Pyrodinium bahamense, Strain pbaha01" /LENGTH=112 /DNA_ID=CAMNT_0020914521 /DNA_START=51 /DNA_END=390 /DNA_ORIENTATION=-